MHNALIEPIDRTQKQQVIVETARYITLASNLFEKTLMPIPVNFSLSGYSLGLYRVSGESREIRYNPYVFAKYFDQNVATTIPHEVAHYVVDRLFGMRNVRPHGKEWQNVMAAFGCEATRTCELDLSGIPIRRQKRYDYHCDCAAHQLSANRHNKILRGKASYSCKKCQVELNLTSLVE